MIGLIDRMDTYSLTGATGLYSTQVATAVPCRLALLRSGRSVEDRAALAAMRHLLWDAGTVVDEQHRVEINGERWSFVKGTVQPVRGPNGNVAFRRGDVVKVV